MTKEFDLFEGIIKIQTLYHGMLKDLHQIAIEGDISGLTKKIELCLKESEKGLALSAESFREYTQNPDIGMRLMYVTENYILSKKALEAIKKEQV